MIKRSSLNKTSKVHYLFDKVEESENSSSLSHKLKTIEEEVRELKPTNPVYFLRPNSVKQSATFFLENFVGGGFVSKVLYSIKSNPCEEILRCLFDAGIRNFDVASEQEIKLVDSLFGNAVNMYYMHPVKSRESIKEAYFDFGIRDFSLDSFEELDKTLEETNYAKDLNLHIRLAIPNAHAAIDLTGKFGILPGESIELLKEAKKVAGKVGICFHVGSQCMEASQYRSSLEIAKDVLDQSGVEIDILDIGGGFPVSYPGMMPAHLSTYFDEIFDVISKMPLKKDCEIWCEPGRALVAESGSLLVRVEARKKNMLYINDGTYGGLFDAGSLSFIYPTKALRMSAKELDSQMEPFGFYGPTCDSLDVMKGPFYLPKDINEGDYIEIGQLGAYSRALRTNFNGFGDSQQIMVSDKPLLSSYELEESFIDCDKEEKITILKQERI